MGNIKFYFDEMPQKELKIVKQHLKQNGYKIKNEKHSKITFEAEK